MQNGADRSALFLRCFALEDTPDIELFVGYEFRNPKMSTQLLKAILSQSPEIQLFILLAFVSYSQHQSIEIQPKTKFTKQKLILVGSQVGEFGIVNIIGWFDPISGLSVGFCFLLWHLVQALIAERKDD
ncbi:hypothetical protein [Aerosakkonema sp. BLCC-F183]|uniref:hypothetical protein n=1 Tax=Aerosakkonema sp. BLCC-F183 TaxID=3342834 RepID=UPI0035BBC079